MNQICLGCKEECKWSAHVLLTGCNYVDSPYSRYARIWFSELLLTGAASKELKKTEIEKKYPEAWNMEEH